MHPVMMNQIAEQRLSDLHRIALVERSRPHRPAALRRTAGRWLIAAAAALGRAGGRLCGECTPKVTARVAP